MIAISYRREDSLPIAGRLYDRLQTKFGKKNVFMDFDSIPPGTDFRQHIKKMIERSKVVIAIIGPHWLGEQPDASRRIDNPADFVRLEIAYALQGAIPVVPLLINNTQMPKPEMLPSDIQELAFRHALPLDSGMDFHNHADRLIAGIGKVQHAERKRPWTGLKRVVGISLALLFAVAALASWYVAWHRPSKSVSHVPATLVRVTNSTFGFSALVPVEVFPDAAQASANGQTMFSSADGRTRLNLFIRQNQWQNSLDEIYNEWAREHTKNQPNKVVQYKVMKQNWFVVSGKIDLGTGFYIKAVAKEDIFVLMYLEYKEGECPISEDTLTAMSKAFTGN